MSKIEIINKTAEYIEKTFKNTHSGHDWWHMWRVWQNAKLIGRTEKVDMFIVEMGALLHDISDWKYNPKKDSESGAKARDWLKQFDLSKKAIDHICNIVSTVSFKGTGMTLEMKTLEGKVVRDADRLDAMGAIGIARTFAYGGSVNRPIYDPTQKPRHHQTSKEYVNTVSPTINHFYEKLLLLKNLMNTESAKKIAKGRHKYMEDFLKRFYDEWDGRM